MHAVTQHFELIRFHVILNWASYNNVSLLSGAYIISPKMPALFYLRIYLQFKTDIGNVLFARPFDNKIVFIDVECI